MATIEASVVINQPIDKVFAYVTDSGSWPQWEDGLLKVEQTSKGPMGVGTDIPGSKSSSRPTNGMDLRGHRVQTQKKVGTENYLEELVYRGELDFRVH